MISQIFYSGPSIEILHEQYAKQGRIDEMSPVKTATDIYIEAPVEQVWEQLIKLVDWPTIDPSFRNVHLESTVKVDASFKFVLNNFPIRAKFAVVTPNRELTWTGVSLWFKAVDVHRLEQTNDGGTRLYSAESFAGFMGSLFVSSEQLQKQHDKWLIAFKQAIENRDKKF